MRSVDDIQSEFGSNDRYRPQPGQQRKKPARTQTRTSEPRRSRQPAASHRASALAQIWYDHGTASGFEFPYDVNYFALALQRKIENDPEFRPYLVKNKHDQVQRWVAKMIEIWWNPVGSDDLGGYLTGDVSARNAKEMFLATDWEDLRDFAKSCLRAAYLKEHGRRVDPPIYGSQQEYQERLSRVRREETVRTYVENLEEASDRPEVDESARDRLRSWRDKRRKK
jgi:hypothetical protein